MELMNNELKMDDIFNRYYNKIFNYLSYLTGKYEAEDVTQEVFIKISKGLDSFRNESQLWTWIYKIATNAALDKLRSSSFRKIHQNRSIADIPAEAIAEHMNNFSGQESVFAEQKIIHKEMNLCIRKVIENMPESYKTILLLKEIQGMKNNEIAEILDISLDTVKIRLHRARANLKQKLKTCCNFYRNENNEFSCEPKNDPEILKILH